MKNYIKLIELQAEQVFANKAIADRWLNQPKSAFGGRTPLELAKNEPGFILVKNELERINDGYAC
jgi:uncharacterized protein (DUF2384 family)